MQNVRKHNVVEEAAGAERAAQSGGMAFVLRRHELVEAAGIEPASGKAATTVTTCGAIHSKL